MSERRVSARIAMVGVALAAATALLRLRPSAGRLAPAGSMFGPAPGPVPSQYRTRERALRGSATGRPAAGGFRAAWMGGGPDAAGAEHVQFQYASLAHQSEAAVSGMWLFLATEVLFFGALFLVYAVYRSGHAGAIAEASRHARLGIGTANTMLLVSSSAVFAYGLGAVRAGRQRVLSWSLLACAAIGVAFLMLKGFEWKLDFDDHLFPGVHFAITGANAGPARLFWCFYFVATGLHGLHMIAGIGWIAWIARRARAGTYGALYHTPVEVAGLYWSFVDMVWLLLFPMIYLAGGVAR